MIRQVAVSGGKVKADQTIESNETIESGTKLTIVLNSVKSDKGYLHVRAVSRKMYEEDYRELVKTSRTVKPKIGTQTVEILDVPPGEYVVQAHHDLNGNQRMDKNFFGFPKEHWGMSGDPKIKITIPKSLPKWDEVKINVAEDEDKRIEIRMRKFR